MLLGSIEQVSKNFIVRNHAEYRILKDFILKFANFGWFETSSQSNIYHRIALIMNKSLPQLFEIPPS